MCAYFGRALSVLYTVSVLILHRESFSSSAITLCHVLTSRNVAHASESKGCARVMRTWLWFATKRRKISTWAFPSESSSNYKFRWSPSHVDPSSSHTSTIDKPSTKLVSRMVSKSMCVPRFVCARKIGTPFWVLVSCEVRVIYNSEAQIEDDLSVALLWLGKDMIWSLDSQFLINFEFALLQVSEWCTAGTSMSIERSMLFWLN